MLKDALIESISFSGAIALAIFVGHGLLTWDWYEALLFGGIIWLVFWFVMFVGSIFTGGFYNYENLDEG